MYEAAIAQLTINAETCENNTPIWEKEGNQEQAECSRNNAISYRAAIHALTIKQMEQDSIEACE